MHATTHYVLHNIITCHTRNKTVKIYANIIHRRQVTLARCRVSGPHTGGEAGGVGAAVEREPEETGEGARGVTGISVPSRVMGARHLPV